MYVCMLVFIPYMVTCLIDSIHYAPDTCNHGPTDACGKGAERDLSTYYDVLYLRDAPASRGYTSLLNPTKNMYSSARLDMLYRWSVYDLKNVPTVYGINQRFAKC